MRQYFVKYKKNMSNCYNLVYADTQEQQDEAVKSGYIRIQKWKAEELASEERQRRKRKPSHAYLADDYIFPYGVDDDFNNYPWVEDGYMIVHV